jgi:phosphopantetheinyl transferase (holo-ACP synthase)
MENTKSMHKGFKKFLLIFAILALIFSNKEAQEKALNFINKLTKKDIEMVLDVEYQGENLIYFKKSLIRWQNKSITYFNEDGSDKWNKRFNSNNVEIKLGDEYIYIVDKQFGDIYVMNNNGDTLSRTQIDKEIFNIKEFGNYYIIHAKDNTMEGLYIVDENGQIINEIETSENILTYCLNENKTDYLFSTLNASDSELKSVIYKNDIMSKEEKLIELSNEIIVFTEFIYENPIIITNKRIIFIKDDEIQWEVEHDGFKDILVKDNEIYILKDSSLRVISSIGEEENIDLSIDANKIIVLGNLLGVHGEKELVILQNKKEILKYKGEDDIVNVLGNDDYIAVHYENKINVFNLDR